ncbi:MAG: right-handed parallel beta-helix repeat-containing protein [Sedimentisphaerales bacterium]
MKTRCFFTLVLLLTVLSTTGWSKVYFVSPDGDDDKSGLSIKDAWKSLDKVNEVAFEAGDQVLFESGGVWKGQLQPQGSGEEGKPIVLSSYGDKGRPVINIGRAEGAGIRLTNQSWWEISNMEVTSGAAPEVGIGRQGIVALMQGGNQSVRHIVVRNCYVHDIWGQLGGRSQYSGYNSCAILVRGRGGRGGNASMSDVLIENNRIERFDKAGIIVNGGQSNVIVRGNTMDNLGGDGIIVQGGSRALIEYNVVKRSCMRSGLPDLPGDENWWPHTAAIWIQNTTETVMQFNEVYDTGRQPRNGDGNAYDFDFGCRRCICQYNYSKNNHGFLLIMNRATENIARYNISENDQTHLIQFQCNIEEGNLLYNNVFYVDYGTSDLDFFCGDDGTRDKSKLGAYVRNNIFYATGQGRFRTVYTSGYAWERQFDETIHLPKEPGTLFHHNCYFGPWKNGLPEDAEKLVADPMFVAPGTGKEGLASLVGYKLQLDSPCINAGTSIEGNGGRDFYGNPVNDGSPDIGVYEQLGSGAFPKTQTQEETK